MSIANGTELMEAVITIDVIRRACVDVTVAPIEKQQLRVDACHGVKIIADSFIFYCSHDAFFDLIALPVTHFFLSVSLSFLFFKRSNTYHNTCLFLFS